MLFLQHVKKLTNVHPGKLPLKKLNMIRLKNRLYMKDAWLEIYDFPVIYFPKFFHPDPSVAQTIWVS